MSRSESKDRSTTGRTLDIMSSGKNNDTREQCVDRECEAGPSGVYTHRMQTCMKRTQEDEDMIGRRKTLGDEASGTLKRCVSESFVQPGPGTSKMDNISESVQDVLLTEASKSYRNSLLINQKLPPARGVVGTGSHTRLSSRFAVSRSRRDSPWPSNENLMLLTKNRSRTLIQDDAPPDGMESEDQDDGNQVKFRLRKTPAVNEIMLADRMALWDPWAGVGVAVDQVEQRPVVVVHSEPLVTTSSILKTGRPISEQGATSSPSLKKRVKWRETVDVILYSGDSEVGRHTEQLREEWAGRSAGFGLKRSTIDRCPYIDPGPLH